METVEGLISGLRETCSGLSDKRRGKNSQYAMADIGMAAFAVFFMQSPSFLAHQRHLTQKHGRSNCETLFAMTKIPSDNHIRAMLDPLRPQCLHPVFADVVAALERGGGLTAFRRLAGHVLIAFDGTEYYRSAKLHCPRCSTRKRSGGSIEYFHSLVAATLVAPGHNRVVALEPEFVVPQDGHDKQDCESMAARRWLAAHGPSYARLDPVYLGDDLYSRQPTCQAVRAVGGHFLFVCKPSSHPTIEEYLTGIELPELTKRVKHGRQRSSYTYRWLADVARLQAQARLIAAYEESKWPRRPPSTADLIRHLMEQHGLTNADMVPILGHAEPRQRGFPRQEGIEPWRWYSGCVPAFRFRLICFLPPLQKTPRRRSAKRAAA